MIECTARNRLVTPLHGLINPTHINSLNSLHQITLHVIKFMSKQSYAFKYIPSVSVCCPCPKSCKLRQIQRWQKLHGPAIFRHHISS